MGGTVAFLDPGATPRQALVSAAGQVHNKRRIKSAYGRIRVSNCWKRTGASIVKPFADPPIWKLGSPLSLLRAKLDLMGHLLRPSWTAGAASPSSGTAQSPILLSDCPLTSAFVIENTKAQFLGMHGDSKYPNPAAAHRAIHACYWVPILWCTTWMCALALRGR